MMININGIIVTIRYNKINKRKYLRRLIYSSIASKDVDFNIISDILTNAVRNNQENDITGMLLYDGHHFMQCIEGDAIVIDKLYQKISEDSRHHSLYINGKEFDDNRLFSNWNMGYINNGTEIKKMIKSVTGRETFSYEDLSYPHAKLILLQLSFII